MVDVNHHTQPGRVSAVDKLVAHIKAMIRDGEVEVGDPLPSERDLGERFGASRNTVREAFRTLKSYGLVDVKPKAGAVLVDNQMAAVLEAFSFNLTITKETFRDVQGFRKLVEVGIVDRLFAKVTENDLTKLDRLNEQMRMTETISGRAYCDYKLHFDLLSIAQNTTVLQVYRIMQPVIVRLMSAGKEMRCSGVGRDDESRDVSYKTHSRILSCVRERDRLGFQYWMSYHLDEGLKFIDTSVTTALNKDAAWNRRPAG